MPPCIHQLVLCLICLSLGASDAEGGARHSVDQAELVRLIMLGLPIHTVRWEVFGTPEYTNGAPEPTDHVTFIAEIAPAFQSPRRTQQKSHGSHRAAYAFVAARCQNAMHTAQQFVVGLIQCSKLRAFTSQAHKAREESLCFSLQWQSQRCCLS